MAHNEASNFQTNDRSEALPHGRIVRAQLGEDDLAQPVDRFWRDSPIGNGQLPFNQHDLLFYISAAAALGR